MDKGEDDAKDSGFIKQKIRTFNLLNKRKHISNPDLEGILLMPNLLDEKAVLNPSLYQSSEQGPWPFVYRTIKENNKGEEYSEIDFRVLITPTRLSKEKRTIIKPEYEYEEMGCEDPIMTKVGNTYFITYTAYDEKNARIALATTRDFRKIKKHGIISPFMKLEEAEERIGKKEYKKILSNKCQSLKQEGLNLDEFFIWDKDGAIHYDYKNKKWVLLHRIANQIQIAKVDDLKQLKDLNFWEDYLQNIEKHVFMENIEPWERDKIGLGSPLFNIKGRKIGLWHGVQEEGGQEIYRGSFFMVDKGITKIESRLKNPLFNPDKEEFLYKYKNKEGQEKIKRVIFPRGTLKQTESLFVYYGMADTMMGFRSTDINWMISELEHPENKTIHIAA